MAYVCRRCSAVVSDSAATILGYECPMLHNENLSFRKKPSLVYIDNEIAQFISQFWEKQIYTLFSCAGHIRHKTKHGKKKLKFVYPYVFFLHHELKIVKLLKYIRDSPYAQLLNTDRKYNNDSIVSIGEVSGVKIKPNPGIPVEHLRVTIRSYDKNHPTEELDPHLGYVHYIDDKYRGYFHFSICPSYLEYNTIEEFTRGQFEFYSLLAHILDFKWS